MKEYGKIRDVHSRLVRQADTALNKEEKKKRQTLKSTE